MFLCFPCPKLFTRSPILFARFQHQSSENESEISIRPARTRARIAKLSSLTKFSETEKFRKSSRFTSNLDQRIEE